MQGSRCTHNENAHNSSCITYRMKLLLVVAAALAVASCANNSVVDPEFHAWKLKFERSYSSPSEEAEHMQIWLRNREAVLEHNAMADQSNSSY
ncbi:unnamed protein product [Pleuronectes platessa]|uniref:Cathepsin propeptide inhibitor domain-containing protein n=1 Tax=Pleuronectes platessa TaxID=8262 RepID=A0A9N7Z096_PLEPL|nr:unnamed protein product [Pleuronectes platessa]